MTDRPTTTCAGCGADAPDRDMMPLREGGELCAQCARRYTCECGELIHPDKGHPYPVGGGWGLACDDCRAASEQDAATEMPGEGVPPETWEAWAKAAYGNNRETRRKEG